MLILFTRLGDEEVWAAGVCFLAALASDLGRLDWGGERLC